MSGNERPAGNYILNACKQSGFKIRIFTDADTAFNFAASLFPLESKKPNVIFLNHIDVVPANDSLQWKHSPYAGVVLNDTIYGRGCIDMKGIAVMQLIAAYKFLEENKGKELPFNLTILFLSGEESGGKSGAAVITEKYLEELSPVAVFGEGGAGIRGVVPSKPDLLVFTVSLAEKKSLWLTMQVKEKASGHAAVPGQNSANKTLLKTMYKMEFDRPDIDFTKTTRKMIKQIGELNGGSKGFVLKHINWLIFRPVLRREMQSDPLLLSTLTNTHQLTKIYNPPGSPNQIPSLAAAYYDCRLLPGVSSKKFISGMRLKLLHPKIKIDIIDESPDAEESKPDVYYDVFGTALKSVYPGSEVIPVLFPATTDNSYFRAKGIPTFGIMPFEASRSLLESVHGIDERLPVSAFYKGVDVYYNFLKELSKWNYFPTPTSRFR